MHVAILNRPKKDIVPEALKWIARPRFTATMRSFTAGDTQKLHDVILSIMIGLDERVPHIQVCCAHWFLNSYTVLGPRHDSNTPNVGRTMLAELKNLLRSRSDRV